MRSLFALMVLARVAAADPVCGDGIVDDGEACDDGNSRTGDGCAALCTVEPGWFCIGSPSTCATECGDGVIAGTEECDDGNEYSTDGCSSHCTVEPGWSCEQQPSACVGMCGDGIVAGTEECDDGNSQDGDGCTTDCHLESEGGSDVRPDGTRGTFDPPEAVADKPDHPAYRATIAAKPDDGGCNTSGQTDLSLLVIAALVLLRRRA